MRVNCRLKNVFKHQITKAIYMVEFENGDFVMAKYWHDASYEVDLARMAGVKMRQGRESVWHLNEPVDYPDAAGLVSSPGFNPDLPREVFALHDSRGSALDRLRAPAHRSPDRRRRSRASGKWLALRVSFGARGQLL